MTLTLTIDSLFLFCTDAINTWTFMSLIWLSFTNNLPNLIRVHNNYGYIWIYMVLSVIHVYIWRLKVKLIKDCIGLDYGADCGGRCDYRCSKAGRHTMCLRACNTCCQRCNCVPPGTSGNRDLCPCYARLTTHGGRLKCPWSLTHKYIYVAS